LLLFDTIFIILYLYSINRVSTVNIAKKIFKMGLFSRSNTGKEVQGTIGYFKLIDWWLSEFSEIERDHIVNSYSPMGGNDRSLVEGHCLGYSQSVGQFLSILASWFNNPNDRSIAVRILAKAEEMIGDISQGRGDDWG